MRHPVFLSTYTFGIHLRRNISLQKLLLEQKIVVVKNVIKHNRNSRLSAWQFACHMRKYIPCNLSVTHFHTMLAKVKIKRNIFIIQLSFSSMQSLKIQKQILVVSYSVSLFEFLKVCGNITSLNVLIFLKTFHVSYVETVRSNNMKNQ